ncbi:uncharacterized protein A1O9_09180 [Exophiala aquamarina CBS 119918]|uniref:GST N-terminal domain-containing protein n=1 Tax=Exophiala aquamarina CBS 119918 TaxID=1182545 RepID=A0A072P637_9EURO|nr:uncharacterized protein A1O9_09180 [Exophiala aquamarina CBS 119918]KEF54738.1 hypothetical protein A1O9_09180 [Exophiala aquamarina CBS 119918]
MKGQAKLKLFVFHGGPAPRRVVIYLAERKFPQDFIEIIPCTISAPGAPAEAPGKPAGSVPVLHDESTGFILRESLAIMEYLEDLAEAQGLPTMRGSTPEARAKMREMLGLVDALTVDIEYAPVFGCKLFASVVGGESEQSAAAVRWLLGRAHQSISRIAEYAAPAGRTPSLAKFDGDSHDAEARVSTADCALFAVLQYAENMFGWDLTERYPRLKQFYDAFQRRASAAVPDGTWPAQLTDLTKDWIDY